MALVVPFAHCGFSFVWPWRVHTGRNHIPLHESTPERQSLFESHRQRRWLTLFELPDPGDRAVSHNSLATYLACSDIPSALAESARHQLAAFIYWLGAGLGQDLQTSLRNYTIRFCRAHDAGTPLTVPRVAELLANPTFRPLDDWLRQRQADVAEVQATVDQALDRARQMALEQE
jgi:hypothetical protein